MGPPKATKVNKYQAKCPRGMRAVRHLRALAERARPPCRIGSLKTNHAHPSRKLRQLDRLVDGIREASRRPGKPRWDIAMIFLCEKDWLNALMAPPVTCRIKRRRLRWLRTEPLSVMLQALGEVAIDGIQSQN
jgi:hypothetical protein